MYRDQGPKWLTCDNVNLGCNQMLELVLFQRLEKEIKNISKKFKSLFSYWLYSYQYWILFTSNWKCISRHRQWCNQMAIVRKAFSGQSHIQHFCGALNSIRFFQEPIFLHFSVISLCFLLFKNNWKFPPKKTPPIWIDNQILAFLLRTEVRGDFKIHGTKYF